MDRKTLEYMEVRSKKARVIVTKIENLLACSERVEKVAEAYFADHNSKNLFSLSTHRHDPNRDNSRLFEALKPMLQQVIADEVQKLEQDLAEL